jgi:hypothetical protein
MLVTPPARLATSWLGGLAVTVALVMPWVWLVVFDRVIRRMR